MLIIIGKSAIESTVCAARVISPAFHSWPPWSSKPSSDPRCTADKQCLFYLSCTLWLLYGYLSNISTIVIVNFIGASLELAYALMYLQYTPDRVGEMIERRRNLSRGLERLYAIDCHGHGVPRSSGVLPDLSGSTAHYGRLSRGSRRIRRYCHHVRLAVSFAGNVTSLRATLALLLVSSKKSFVSKVPNHSRCHCASPI